MRCGINLRGGDVGPVSAPPLHADQNGREKKKVAKQLKKIPRNYQAFDDDETPRPPRPRKELRQGFATGTAAAAAAQGVLYELLGRPCPDRVQVTLPGGGSLSS